MKKEKSDNLFDFEQIVAFLNVDTLRYLKI